MIPLAINGRKIKSPDCWDEVSCETWERIHREWEPKKPIKDRDELKLFSILNNTDYEAIFDSKDYYLEAMIYSCIEFVYKEDFTNKPRPDFIKIGERTVKVPTDLGRLTVGQNNHVRKLMRQFDPETNEPIDTNLVLVSVAAIYLQPFWQGSLKDDKFIPAKFDYYEALALEMELRQMPITVVYPIGFFFLNLLANYGTWWAKLLGRIRHRTMISALPLLRLLRHPNLTHILRSLL